MQAEPFHLPADSLPSHKGRQLWQFPSLHPIFVPLDWFSSVVTCVISLTLKMNSLNHGLISSFCHLPTPSAPLFQSKLLEKVVCILCLQFFSCPLLVVVQSCLTLCDPMDYSAPGFSVHGFSQARILEWVAISFSRGSSWLRGQTQVSCIGRRILYCLIHPLLKVLQLDLLFNHCTKANSDI